MIKLYKLRDYDFRLVIALIILSFIGVLLVGSAEASLQNRQLMGMILGLIVMVVVSLIDFSWILNLFFEHPPFAGSTAFRIRCQRRYPVDQHRRISFSAYRADKNCDHYILRTFFYGA